MSNMLEHSSMPDVAFPQSMFFAEMRQRLHLYLIALWGQTFSIEAKGTAVEQATSIKPSISHQQIQLPPSMSDSGTLTARTVYLATAAHAAAHLQFSGPFNPKKLNARQRFIVELIEDARVEYLAAQRFPGLKLWWLALHSAECPDPAPFPTLMWRLSRGLLLLEDSTDKNFLVRKAIDLFLERRDRLDDPLVSREIGLRIAHDIGQMRLSMDEGQVPPLPCFRDDNQYLWVEEREPIAEQQSCATEETLQQYESGAFLQEAEKGSALAFSESSASVTGAGEEGYRVNISPESASLEFRQHEAETTLETCRYPEWFERIDIAREDWCTVSEHSPEPGDLGWADMVLAANRSLLANLRRVVTALRSRHMMRVRRLEHGDELDLDAALRSLADMRNGEEPDPRIYMRNHPLDDQALALSLLLDLSESINEPDPLSGRPILEFAREAVLLLARTAMDLGSPLALAGFRSDGRHQVDIQRVKDFGDPLDALALQRLAGLTGSFSTRMGAAIRHACAGLAEQEAHHRLLLVMTDGEPSDIDVFDPQHLLDDARHAVFEARLIGVQPFGVSLDPRAEEYMTHIFGVGHFLVLDHLGQLPARLSRLLLRLVGKGF